MGLTGSPTTTLLLEDVPVPEERRIGAEGEGIAIALRALDSGRLGIAAVAVGVAQAALDHAVAYARERKTFGKPIIDHQGLAFLLADMAAAVASARAVTLDAARRRDRGLPFGSSPRSPSSWPPTPRCRSRPTPSRCSAATATRRSSPSSG